MTRAGIFVLSLFWPQPAITSAANFVFLRAIMLD
jgi:hypothetical protein